MLQRFSFLWLKRKHRFLWHFLILTAQEIRYQELLALVKDKDYFVLTTNVDHQFQRSAFDKKKLFYTQGDYGLWQCSKPATTEPTTIRQTSGRCLPSSRI